MPRRRFTSSCGTPWPASSSASPASIFARNTSRSIASSNVASGGSSSRACLIRSRTVGSGIFNSTPTGRASRGRRRCQARSGDSPTARSSTEAPQNTLSVSIQFVVCRPNAPVQRRRNAVRRSRLLCAGCRRPPCSHKRVLTPGSSKQRSDTQAAKGRDTDRGLGDHHVRFASDGYGCGLIGQEPPVLFVAQAIEKSLRAWRLPLQVPAIRVHLGIQLINEWVREIELCRHDFVFVKDLHVHVSGSRDVAADLPARYHTLEFHHAGRISHLMSSQEGLANGVLFLQICTDVGIQTIGVSMPNIDYRARQRGTGIAGTEGARHGNSQRQRHSAAPLGNRTPALGTDVIERTIVRFRRPDTRELSSTPLRCERIDISAGHGCGAVTTRLRARTA